MKISRKLITVILLLPCAAFGWPSSGGGVSSTSSNKAGLTPIAITVGASPFAYTATATGSVAVSGGAVTNMTLTRGGTVVWNTTLSSDVIPVTLNDVVTVTYTTAPTMNELPN